MAASDTAPTDAVGLAGAAGAGVGEASLVGGPGRPRQPGRRRWRLGALGLLVVAVGIVAVAIGTAVMTDVNAWGRVAVSLVGAICIYVGLDYLGKAFFGNTFDTGLWLAVAWMALIVLSAIFADLLPLAEHENVSLTLAEPSLLRPDLFSSHPLGTDGQGLDVLGGVIYGARVSLAVGIGAVLIGMLVGAGVGIVAGFYRGKVDGGVGLVADAMLAFPPLILLLAMVAVLEPSTRNTAIALAVLTVPTYIRLSRANTLVFAQREFVLAARGLGAKNQRIILRELLPNVALPVVSYAFIIVGALIVAEASLSFLGLGIQRPTPTWGNMIAAGQSQFDRDPHIVFIPATCLFMTVFALNRVGERARKIWDPGESRL